MFLMLATRFETAEESDQQFDVQLATAANAKALTPLPDELIINVTGKGQFFVNGKRRSLTELESDLVAAKKNYADQAVLVRGEGEGRYQNVVDVMAACDRAKINVVSLPVRLKTEVHP